MSDAMATIKHLVGNGVWDTASNWPTANTVPADGDELVIPGSLNNDCGGNMDDSGFKYDFLFIQEEYRKNVGTSGAPLKAASKLIDIRGHGDFFFSCALGAGDAHQTDKIFVNARNQKSRIELNSVSGDAGGIQDSYVNRGDTTIKGDINFVAASTLRVGHISDIRGDATVTIDSTAQVLPTLIQAGGMVTCSAPVTAADISMGTYIQKEQVAALVDVRQGGVFKLRHTAATTVIIHSGGTLDWAEAYEERTITTLILMPGAIVRGKFQVGSHPLSQSYNAVTTLHDHRDVVALAS